MVDKGKSKQALSKMLKEDRISQLPDPLLCQIHSYGFTKKAVTTSVLSNRWRSLWLWVPKLELFSRKFQYFNAFVSFGDMFFDSNRVYSVENSI